MTTHLVIGDSHARPGANLDRFVWLGNLIMDRKPDVIVSMGDWADMESLCSYDKGTKGFEGRRYQADCDAAIEAQELMLKPLWDYNNVRRRNKERLYRPRLVKILGNHENRINRMVNTQPEFEGKFGIDDLKYQNHGWEVIPYEQPFVIDGITYCHHVPSGIMGRPIGGLHQAYAMLQKNHCSTTVGHSHVLDFKVQVRADGTKIYGLSAGCYIEERMPFAASTDKWWWRGLVFKHNVRNGEYDPEFIELDRVRNLYG